MENQEHIENDTNYDSEEYIPKGDIVQHTDKAVDIIVQAKDVGISEEEAQQFQISPLSLQFKKIISSIQRVIAELLGMDYTVKAQSSQQNQVYSATMARKIQKIAVLARTVDNTFKSLDVHLPQMLEFAKTRGILEGINGYRSFLVVLLRVLEKLEASFVSCPVLPSKNWFTNTPFSTKRWRENANILIDQLRVITVLMIEIYKHAEETRDLFLTQETDSTSEVEAEENALFSIISNLPTECFFGIHFGAHYPLGVQKILRMILLANASFSTAKKTSESWILKGPLSLMYGAYYNFSSKAAATKFVDTQSNSNVQELKEFWNLTELPVTELASSIVSTSVEMHYKLEIKPKKIEFFTSDGKKQIVNPPSLPPSMITPQTTDISLSVKARYVSVKKLDVYLFDECEKWRENFLADRKRFDLFQVSFYPPIIAYLKRVRSFSLSSTLPNKTPEEIEKEVESQLNVLSPYLIIHYHGGGFVAQSPASHMPYLRDWTHDTNAPILSIEYRLAPEFAFPVALEECYFAYMWAVKNSKKLGSTGEKIILVGDSAGGNLAAAVTIMSIMQNTRIPDGLILCYPALYMSFVPSPARALSVFDPMLNTASLKECFKAYTPKDMEVNTIHYPLFSPASASNEVLSKFPTHTYIMCGTLDPLFDDSIYFVKRMVEVKKPIVFKVLEGYPHGFLNLAAFPSMGKELQPGVNQASAWMNQIFKGKKA